MKLEAGKGTKSPAIHAFQKRLALVPPLLPLNGVMKKDWRATIVRFGLVGRLGLALLLLLVSAAPATAAINLVTSAKASGPNVGAASPWYLQVDVNTPGNSTVVVAVAVKNTAVTPGSVTDSGGSLYVLLADQIVNVTYARVTLWATVAAGAKNSTWVRVNTCCTGTDMVAAVASYSGVVSLGSAVKAFTSPASSTAQISVPTSDANSWVVAAMATAGNSTLGGSTGNLRQNAIANATVGGALMDNTSATPVSNTLSILPTPQYTAMAAVELRTVPGISLLGTPVSSAVSNNVCTMSGIPAAGINLPGKVNVVVVAFGATGGNNSVSTITENPGPNTYTQRAVINGGATARTEIWTASGGTGTVNVTLPGSVKVACAVATYVGVAAFGSTTTASGTTTNPSTAALTTQDYNNVVVGGFAWTGATTATAFAGGGTLEKSAATSGGSGNTTVALVDKTSTTTASLTTQATHGSGQWAVAALELRASRSGWNYTTGGANMAPPALDPWNNIVVAGSNDNKLHVLADTDGLQKFAPFAGAAGPIASRPTVIPAGYSTTGLNIAYFGSQDGYVYAVDTATGTQVAGWNKVLLPTTGGMVQGGVAIGLKAGGLTALTHDLVFVGTSNVSSDANYKSDNKVYALDGNNGNVVWTFAPSSPGMDIISSTPYVDYANSAVWVTSRSNTNSQPSVWKLRLSDGLLLASWSKVQGGASPLGDIDSAPNGSADGSVVYVGTNGGTINAIKTGASYTGLDPAGSIVTYTPVSTAPCNCTGAGTVKMPWWLSFSMPDTIIFSRNATVHSVSFNGTTTFTPNWTVTPTGAPTSVSGPVDDGVNHYIYVGGSDGKVHQLDLTSNGTDTKQLPVSASTPTLGDPTFNADLNLLYIGGTDGRTYTFQVPLPLP